MEIILSPSKEYTMNTFWLNIFEKLDFAFQPIVSLSNGKIFALEALVRNYQKAGFDSIIDIFDEAYQDGVLFNFDLYMRRKAIQKFKDISFYKKTKLFYNYDPRCLEMSDYYDNATETIIQENGLNMSSFCYEINEKNKFKCYNSFAKIFTKLRERGLNYAIDDFGSGFSGLELMYYSEPNFIKFDRFMIENIDKLPKKKIITSNILNLSKSLGILTIAEGIETKEELEVCYSLGFDFVQGYYINMPEINIDNINYENKTIIDFLNSNKRTKESDYSYIEKEVAYIDPVSINTNFHIVFEKFHSNTETNFFPVVDENLYPLGIIHERNIKKFVYSPYGKEILLNKSVTKSIKDFIIKCPISDIYTTQKILLGQFVLKDNAEGILITKENKYVGFLSSRSLINIVHNKEVEYAIDLNPLTKLPGNSMIEKFIDETIENTKHYRIYVYYDFDNFKPFNDKFGFRLGDKVIKDFANILQKMNYNINCKNKIVAHIGGDDFFCGYLYENDLYDNNKFTQVQMGINSDFKDFAKKYYSDEDIKNNKYYSTDRYGVVREFGLLSVTSIIIVLNPNSIVSKNELSEKTANLKHLVKEKNEWGIVYFI